MTCIIFNCDLYHIYIVTCIKNLKFFEYFHLINFEQFNLPVPLLKNLFLALQSTLFLIRKGQTASQNMQLHQVVYPTGSKVKHYNNPASPLVLHCSSGQATFWKERSIKTTITLLKYFLYFTSLPKIFQPRIISSFCLNVKL